MNNLIKCRPLIIFKRSCLETIPKQKAQTHSDFNQVSVKRPIIIQIDINIMTYCTLWLTNHLVYHETKHNCLQVQPSNLFSGKGLESLVNRTSVVLIFIKKIPHTGDKASLDRCGQQHRYHSRVEQEQPNTQFF